MALHGDIRVNGAEIGRWHAIRVETGEDNLYECAVSWTPIGESPIPHGGGHFDHSRVETFMIYHRFEDGAVHLTAKILNAAVEKINEREVS